MSQEEYAQEFELPMMEEEEAGEGGESNDDDNDEIEDTD